MTLAHTGHAVYKRIHGHVHCRVTQSERVQPENHPSRQGDSRVPEGKGEFLETTATVPHCLYKRTDQHQNGIRSPRPDPTLLDGATKHSNSKGVSILNSIDDDDAFLRQMTTRHRPKTRQATPNNQETQVAVAIAAAVVAAVAIALAVWRRKSRHRREPQLKERSRRTLAAHRTKCRES